MITCSDGMPHKILQTEHKLKPLLQKLTKQVTENLSLSPEDTKSKTSEAVLGLQGCQRPCIPGAVSRGSEHLGRGHNFDLHQAQLPCDNGLEA
jgi:hypothetical protein